MKKKLRSRVGRRLSVTRPASGVANARLTLSELSFLMGGAILKVEGVGSGGDATHRSFSFEGSSVSGEYDEATGGILGVDFAAIRNLVAVAWGEDSWIDRRYVSMVPPPDLKDARGIIGEGDASAYVGDLGPDGMVPGEAEVVLRVDLAALKEVLRSRFG